MENHNRKDIHKQLTPYENLAVISICQNWKKKSQTLCQFDVKTRSLSSRFIKKK